ncbi:MAG TPA: PspA/IM30 family protein [Allosphingosinicella sp.]|jgi:phage shock protein A|nr:PspA/IM30 family protein [Allosphingosinicella sp.]
MPESIFARVQRVLSASAESSVDALERVSGTSLMREAIREVDRAAAEIRIEIEANASRRSHAARQQQMLAERLATLDEQARFALGRGRDDLAEAAVARQIDCEAQVVQLKRIQAQTAEEEKRLDECFAALKVRKAQMEKELADFEAARGETRFGRPRPTAAERSREKVARAEATFERAMAAAGAPGVGLMDAEDAAKLAEVEALRKADAIADRLAALRAAADKKGAGTGTKPR